MAYYTGSVSNPSDLKTIIETECVVNGWSLSGGWLSKGINHISLSAPDANYLNITGANSADGLTEPSGITHSIYIPNTYWPVTYYLHILTAPDQVIVVVNYNAHYCQTIMFGDIVKVNNSAFVGGNWYFGTTGPDIHSFNNSQRTGLDTCGIGTFSVTGSEIDSYIYCGEGGYPAHPSSVHAVPFAKTTSYYGVGTEASYVQPFHAKIDSDIWDNALTPLKVSYTDQVLWDLYRSPNTWNQQAHLVPMNLQYKMADNFYAYLGYIDHIRLIRNDNYEIGDILTIAPDEWKIYPWFKKDTVYRNGRIGTSGTVGFAVRYDGP